MPYRNILWIKLEKRLLNDSRFFLMSEKSQLIYVKLLMLSAETNNKIPSNSSIMRQLLRTKLRTNEIAKCLREIQIKFPKFKKSGLFYYFEEWENRVNRTSQGTPQELPRSSEVSPQDAQEKKRKEQDKEQEQELVIKLKNWNERQSSPIPAFRPENIINKHGFEKIDQLLKTYGKINNGFSQFLSAIKQ